MQIPAVAVRMAQKPVINEECDVPDLAGYSVDGRTVYIDRHFAESQLAQSDKPYLVVHEHVEKTLIDVLSYSYAQAHEMATAAEHQAVGHSDYNAKSYEKALAPYIKRAELEKITNPPMDLDCHPYYEDPDAQDLKILARLAELGVKDAQHPQVKLSHAVVQYGPGHRPEYCERCEHWDGSRSYDDKNVIGACWLVEDPIEPKGWCRLWRKK